MKFLTTIILLTTFLTAHGQTSGDTTKFTSEIPTWSDGHPVLFFSLDQQKAKQLSLKDLQAGFDSLQIRVWYEYSLSPLRELLVISRTSSSWTASIYTMTVDWDASKNTETVNTTKHRTANPKNGWDNFIENLIALQIMTLPDMDDIPGLDDGLRDGISYNVEVATKKAYRFYGYHLPCRFQNKYWQAKNMIRILKLIEKNFGIKCNCK